MKHNKELRDIGYTIFPKFLDKNFIKRLSNDLDVWIEYASDVRRKTGLGDVMAGVAHHVMGKDDAMADLVRSLPFDQVLKEYFDGPYILNSFGGLKYIKGLSGDYSHVSSFHRDVRTYSPNLSLLINVLIMLEDFTVSNGATRVIPYSHRVKEKPADDELLARAEYLTGKAGTVVLFDSNLWHSASTNIDGLTRRALTMTYSRPFIKPQMDYCKLVGEHFSSDPDVMQVIGFRSRVPQSHEDWYQPYDRRFYYSDQG